MIAEEDADLRIGIAVLMMLLLLSLLRCVVDDGCSIILL